MKQAIFVFTLAFLPVQNSFSQGLISIEGKHVDEGENICVNVSASSDSIIESVFMHITFDTTVIQIDEPISNEEISGLAIVKLSSDTIRIAYLARNFQNYKSLDFDLCFKVIGDKGDFTSLKLTNYIEFHEKNRTPIEFIKQSGYVSISDKSVQIPTARCIDKIVVEIDEEPVYDIIDLNAGSFDDITANEYLFYAMTFSSVDALPPFSF